MAEDDLTSIVDYYKRRILSKFDWIIHISVMIAAASWYPQSRVIFGFLLIILTGIICFLIFSVILSKFSRSLASPIFGGLKLFSWIYILISYTFFIALILNITPINDLMFSFASNHLCHTYIGDNNLCIISTDYIDSVLNLINSIGNMAELRLGL